MKKINIIFSLLLMFIGIGCSNDQGQDLLDNKEVGFTITIHAPQGDGTRASNTDGVTPPTSKEDKLADGWAFNHLTLFSVSKKSNIVIAYRDVNFEQAKESHTFDFNKNTEGNIVAPEEGAYDLYIVANYDGNTELKNAIDKVLTALGKDGTKPTQGLSTTSTQWSDFMSQNINPIRGNLASNGKTAMPLSLKEEVLLKPGLNDFKDLHLIRAYSRIIVEMRNESQGFDMQINNFAFNTNFTAKSIPVFANGSLNEADAKPNVKSTNAITPFKPTNGGTIPHLAPNEICTLFDGYILESKASQNGYKFLLEVAVRDNQTIEYYRQGQSQASMNKNQQYMIRNKDGLYLALTDRGSGQSRVAAGRPAPNFEDIKQCQDYLWYHDGNSIISVKLEKDYEKEENPYKFMDGKSENEEITFQNSQRALTTQNNNIYWWKWESGNWSYFYIDNDFIWKKTRNGEPGNFRFDFLPVTKDTKNVNKITHSSIIPFKYLVDAIPVTVSEITRNSFFHVLFNVRYNNRFGTFEFSVMKWKDVNGDIEFN